jgi:hypothetical protein
VELQLHFVVAAAGVALQAKPSLRLLDFMRFQNNTFLQGEVSPPPPQIPQPGGPGYPFSCGSSSVTCLVWEALPAATLPPAEFSGSLDHTTAPPPQRIPSGVPVQSMTFNYAEGRILFIFVYLQLCLI